MTLLRSTFLASLLVFAVPNGSVALDEIPSREAPGTDLRQLRQEIETLRRRIDELKKQRAPREANPITAAESSRLKAEAEQIVSRYRQAKAEVWKQAHTKIRELRQETAKVLTEMQDGYTRRAKLDEALAIREAIRSLHESGRTVLPAPQNLSSLVTDCRVLYFRVTGAASGSVYGTDIYTSDSSLSAAAVHAGLVKDGETGIVKVTTIPNHQGYTGSTRNGVTTSSWSSYPGYRLEAVGDEDQDLLECNPTSEAVIPLDGTAPPKPMPPGSERPILCSTPELPRALPAEAREQIEGFTNTSSDLRKTAREKVARLTEETVTQLTPIQDAHTRAARLDEALAVRELIRTLTEGAKVR